MYTHGESTIWMWCKDPRRGSAGVSALSQLSKTSGWISICMRNLKLQIHHVLPPPPTPPFPTTFIRQEVKLRATGGETALFSRCNYWPQLSLAVSQLQQHRRERCPRRLARWTAASGSSSSDNDDDFNVCLISDGSSHCFHLSFLLSPVTSRGRCCPPPPPPPQPPPTHGVRFKVDPAWGLLSFYHSYEGAENFLMTYLSALSSNLDFFFPLSPAR